MVVVSAYMVVDGSNYPSPSGRVRRIVATFRAAGGVAGDIKLEMKQGCLVVAKA